MNNYENLKVKQESSHRESFNKMVENDKSCNYLDVENSHGWSRNYPLYIEESLPYDVLCCIPMGYGL